MARAIVADATTKAKMKLKKIILPRISSGVGHYVLKDEDAILINRILARIDRALDIYEKMSNIEAQRFEMEIRESMQRTITRGEQQSAMNKLLPLLASIGKPTLKTKGKKISAKDKRL